MKYQLEVATSRRIQMKDITSQLAALVRGESLAQGLCLIYCPHTTAGLIINENADPDVATDLEAAFEKMVPSISFRHAEGNSPAHLLSSLTGSSLHIPVEGSDLVLGSWQGVFFCEFDGPRSRKVWVKLISD